MRRALRLVLLRLLPRFYRPVGQGRLSPQSELRILLLRPDHLGDVLFTTPALRFLRQALPKARITYMVGEWSQEVVANNPNVDEVITCPFPGFARQPKISARAPYRLLWREAKRLRQHYFDVAINLRFDFWWGAMLAYCAGIPMRIGYNSEECLPFLTGAVPYSSGRHEVVQNLALIRAWLNVPGESGGRLEISPTIADEEFAQGWLSHQGIGTPLVALHPGSGAEVKLWRSESFARLADALAERYQASIIITGSRGEEKLVDQIQGQAQSVVARLSGVGLGQLAAVLRRCDLVVGTDSGVLHLAVALGRPTVHLYGPVREVTFGPWGGDGQHIVVKSDPSCVPCNRLDYRQEELQRHWCVKSISVAEVLSAAEALLSR